jgi:integrase
MKFISFQLDRVNKDEISDATVPNYYKAVKLFCEMNDLTLSWKKISKGLPNRKTSGNDRAPSIDEISKLVKYPDRRIKAIVYTMISSGIRIGAWDLLQWKHVIPIKNQKGEIIAAKLIVLSGDFNKF